MYGETALPGSLPALFHDIYIFFNLSISADSDFPDFRDYFFIFQLLGPLRTQRIKQNGADSKKRRFVNSIQMLLFELFSGQIKVILFNKIQRDISIRSLLYNTFLKLLKETY